MCIIDCRMCCWRRRWRWRLDPINEQRSTIVEPYILIIVDANNHLIVVHIIIIAADVRYWLT